MKGDMPGETVETLGDPEQELQLSHREVDPVQLREPFDRLAQVPRAYVREGLGHDPHLDVGEAQSLPDLSNRRARAIRVDHRDASGAFVAVSRKDHVVYVLPPGRLDID